MILLFFFVRSFRAQRRVGNLGHPGLQKMVLSIYLYCYVYHPYYANNGSDPVPASYFSFLLFSNTNRDKSVVRPAVRLSVRPLLAADWVY